MILKVEDKIILNDGRHATIGSIIFKSWAVVRINYANKMMVEVIEISEIKEVIK